MKCAHGLAGLHAYGLDIKHVTVDGQDASFELRPHVEEALPEQVFEGASPIMPAVAQPAPAACVCGPVRVKLNCSLATCPSKRLCMRTRSGHAQRLCMRAGPSGSHLPAIVADHTFFQYERTLQREYNPELSISLPPVHDAVSAATAAAQPQSTASEEPPAPSAAARPASAQPSASAQPAPGPAQAPGAAAEQAPEGVGELRTVLLKVSYELRQPTTGLHFSGSYVHTGNQA